LSGDPLRSEPLRIALLGATGRMGRALLTALDEAPALALSGASASPNSRWLGHDIAIAHGVQPRGVSVVATPVDAVRNARVAVDFSLPASTATNLAACVAVRCALVIGTTGHDVAAREQIAAAASHIPIVMAPNMSLGVNLLLRLTQLAAQTLDASYDIEVFEAHHRHKKDAPSGTALALGRAAASGRGVVLDQVAEHQRHGIAPRRPGSIGFSVFRGGDVVGDHTVTFAGLGERIEITHRASDRLAFARGALQAARWLLGRGGGASSSPEPGLYSMREPGLYSMQDVLGL
jgi:4-hydroxy-tetrahydrodipicolinate reductase